MIRVSRIGLLAALLALPASLAGCDSDEAQAAPPPPNEPSLPSDCPLFAPSYTSCEKIDGPQPQFFQSLVIETLDDRYAFTTETVQGPFPTTYVPDRVVRLGSDAHTLDNGETPTDLPSLESSYCEDDTLFRREVTVLPGEAIAQEIISMRVDANDRLEFRLTVNGALALEAACTE